MPPERFFGGMTFFECVQAQPAKRGNQARSFRYGP